MPSCLWRAVAAVAAGLVMVLNLSAVSPGLHAWLHAEEPAEKPHTCAHHAAHEPAGAAAHVPASDSGEGETHQCAVTMFSQGVVHYAGALLALPREGVLRAVNFRASARLALAEPRFLHLPPQAPPAV